MEDDLVRFVDNHQAHFSYIDYRQKFILQQSCTHPTAFNNILDMGAVGELSR